MVHAVCETTNLGAVRYAERIFDAVASVDIDNGTIGYLDELVEGTTHMYTFVPGVKEGKKICLAHNPEWNEDECRMTNQRKDKFFIPAGTPFRAYVLKVTDEFALSPEGFSAESRETLKEGKFATVNEEGKLVVADAASEDALMVGQIMRKRQVGATLVTNLREYGYARMMYTVKVIGLGK